MTRRLFQLFLLLVGALAPGCSQTSSDPLRIGVPPWLGFAPLYLGQDLGHLPEDSVRPIAFESSSAQIRAFRNGLIDAVALTLDEVLLLVEQGLAPRIVVVADISRGADAIVARPGLRTLGDLRGRRIAVEGTATGALMLLRGLERAELRPEDVTIVPIEVQEGERALEEGRVDAVVTYEPIRTRLLAAGRQELMNSSHLNDEIVDVIVVRADQLEKRAEQIDRLLDGWFRGLAFFHAHPEEATRLMQPRWKLEPAQLLIGLRGMQIPDEAEGRELLSGARPALRARAEELGTWMHRNGLLQRCVDPSSIIAAAPIERRLR
ncbi:ABC transporter substrate-binding protein [Sorangium sp. So ce1078]|uniref:ABC transporter substrate-binding protein n=1 Tax=Sorangium sp. So ce1078 TaxID=3133329 RepID=UPI003F5D706E